MLSRHYSHRARCQCGWKKRSGLSAESESPSQLARQANSVLGSYTLAGYLCKFQPTYIYTVPSQRSVHRKLRGESCYTACGVLVEKRARVAGSKARTRRMQKLMYGHRVSGARGRRRSRGGGRGYTQRKPLEYSVCTARWYLGAR